MRNLDNFYLAGGNYTSDDKFLSEPTCFDPRITFKEIQAFGATPEEACFNLLQLIYSSIEEADPATKVSVEGVTRPVSSNDDTWKATAWLKIQVIIPAN